MKKVLILVLSSDFGEYSKMWHTSMQTWDSVKVEGVDTMFYCSHKDNPDFNDAKMNELLYNIMYFDVPNDLYSMGHKNLAMYEWALQNREFDFVARINASCYVNKSELIKFVQTLPDEDVFLGAKVVDANQQDAEVWYWGGASFIFSKDVLQKIVDNKADYDHTVMEDKSTSYLINKLKIPVIPAVSGSIDNMGDHWRVISYGGGGSITFTDFADLIPLHHHFYRIKQDGKRYAEEWLMQEMFKTFNQ